MHHPGREDALRRSSKNSRRKARAHRPPEESQHLSDARSTARSRWPPGLQQAADALASESNVSLVAELSVPRLRPMPRPRVSGAKAYLPSDFQAHLDEVRTTLALSHIKLGPGVYVVALVTANTRADIDNVVKTALDALQTTVIPNDRCVAGILAARHELADGCDSIRLYA